MVLMRTSRNLRAGETFSARSRISNPTILQLREAGEDYPEWVTERYLQLPDDFSPRVAELASEITVRGGDTLRQGGGGHLLSQAGDRLRRAHSASAATRNRPDRMVPVGIKTRILQLLCHGRRADAALGRESLPGWQWGMLQGEPNDCRHDLHRPPKRRPCVDGSIFP